MLMIHRPLAYLMPLWLLAAVAISGCETNGAEDTVVIFDENSNDITFANKKYNQKLAAKEEKKWRDKKTLFKSGKTAANPAGGLEPDATELQDQPAAGIVYGEGVYGAGYNAPSPIRYNTQEPTDYEAYKQWRAARGIENSPEYTRFKLWQEFEQFQQWKDAQQ